MAFNTQTFGVIDQILDRVMERQPKRREKANTVTTIIGAVVTSALTLIAFLVEQGTALPGWTPVVVTILGFLGTVLGVNRTKNGFTRSQVEALHREIEALVDAREGDKTTPHVPQPSAPEVENYTPQHAAPAGEGVRSADDIAAELDDIAARIINGQ